VSGVQIAWCTEGAPGVAGAVRLDQLAYAGIAHSLILGMIWSEKSATFRLPAVETE
jgi:hypothetical protein